MKKSEAAALKSSGVAGNGGVINDGERRSGRRENRLSKAISKPVEEIAKNLENMVMKKVSSGGSA